jgi:ATP-dependent DNA helicase RecG
LERLALVTAATEGMVQHGRLREISSDHSSDITKMLGRLVKDGLLVSEGIGRGMRYLLPWQESQAKTLFSDEMTLSLTPELSTLTPELGGIPPELKAIPPELKAIPPELGLLYLEWSQLSDALQQDLKRIAQPVCARKRVAPELLRLTILQLCNGRYLGRRILAQLLNRNPDDLLKRSLNPLVDKQLLKPAFPSSSDPRQAYTTRIRTDIDPQA